MARMRLSLAPETLIWARESIDLSLEDAAKKMQMSALDLRFWEEGVGGPTVSQLRAMARVYKRPMAAFLLDKPPAERDSLPDFRILHDYRSTYWSPTLHEAYRRALFQRSVALDVLADLLDFASAFPRVTTNDHPDEVATAVRDWLGLSSDSPVTPSSSIDVSLADLSYLIERKQILVLQTQHISIREMRGFSITERPFPVIAINGSDAQTAKKFTLTHELAHVLLGASSMCDMQDLPPNEASDRSSFEKFCNRVSAAVLMPRNALLSHPFVVEANAESIWDTGVLIDLADQFGVSEEAMLIRLVSLGRASEGFYWSRRLAYRQRYDPDVSDSVDDTSDQSSSGGPGYYRMKVRDYGRSFVQNIAAAYRQREINAADVSSYLDVKFENLAKLEAVAEG